MLNMDNIIKVKTIICGWLSLVICRSRPLFRSTYCVQIIDGNQLEFHNRWLFIIGWSDQLDDHSQSVEWIFRDIGSQIYTV